MIYIKNTQNSTIKEIEPNPIWLNDKPENVSEYSWNCQRYIKTLGPAEEDICIESSKEEFDSYKLQEAKDAKVAQCNQYLASTDWEAAAFTKYSRPISPITQSNCLKAVEYKKQIRLCKTQADLDLVVVEFEQELEEV